MDPTAWKHEQFKRPGQRRCRYCHRRLTLETATVDHVKPRAHGGRDRRKNFALACKPCNEEKGSTYKEPGEERYAPDPWWTQTTGMLTQRLEYPVGWVEESYETWASRVQEGL
jgi:5-methylcytosine-specific restriction endonuclease McrA